MLELEDAGQRRWRHWLVVSSSRRQGRNHAREEVEDEARRLGVARGRRSSSGSGGRWTAQQRHGR